LGGREADLQRRRRLLHRAHAAHAERGRYRRRLGFGTQGFLRRLWSALRPRRICGGRISQRGGGRGGGRRPVPAPCSVSTGAIDDRIWNGADDDGSGTVGLMALARAFAGGPRPRRSLLFVWHTGEEVGRYGSLYFADHPTVPIKQIIAQLNIDMIGRNRDDKPSEANTLYLVGADRISTQLDEISRAANAAMATPMTLDYEFNDLSDGESL